MMSLPSSARQTHTAHCVLYYMCYTGYRESRTREVTMQGRGRRNRYFPRTC